MSVAKLKETLTPSNEDQETKESVTFKSFYDKYTANAIN